MSRKIFITSDLSLDDRMMELAERDPEAALAWPWLLLAFDDWGRAEANPKRLKMQVFPAFSITPERIEAMLAIYTELHLLIRYTDRGRSYIAIKSTTWFRYQTHIRTEKRDQVNSKCPAPPQEEDEDLDHSLPNERTQSRADARNDAQRREDTRDNAKTRAPLTDQRADARLAGALLPSPSPSLHYATPSLSPSPSPSPPQRATARGAATSSVANGERAAKDETTKGAAQAPPGYDWSFIPQAWEPVAKALLAHTGQRPPTSAKAKTSLEAATERAVLDFQATPEEIARRSRNLLSKRPLCNTWDSLLEYWEDGHAPKELTTADIRAVEDQRAAKQRALEQRRAELAHLVPPVYPKTSTGSGSSSA